ncbi:STAS domain-containing protein [Streptomyces sp. NBC_00690]|uniref:STAS domain-containing protein n=1 Tax=Streptomyces sp. NBC_00690 TaxID=2975808 RepID=UPI002E2A7350|nr:STAS domain-containing protein [Streptomyces sp. NBC_00690]
MSVETADPVGSGPVVLIVSAPVTFADVPPLCARLQALYGAGADEVVCDLAELTRADLASVEAVARLRLTARRAGRTVRMRNAGPELLALLTLMGLDGLTRPDGAAPT